MLTWEHFLEVNKFEEPSFYNTSRYYKSLLLSPLEKECGPSFEQTWIPLIQEHFVPSLVEIGPKALEKMKMWKVCRQTDGQRDIQMDGWKTDIRPSEKVTWNFSSGELKTTENMKDKKPITQHICTRRTVGWCIPIDNICTSRTVGWCIPFRHPYHLEMPAHWQPERRRWASRDQSRGYCLYHHHSWNILKNSIV